MFNNTDKGHSLLNWSASSLVKPTNWKIQGQGSEVSRSGQGGLYPTAGRCPLTLAGSQDERPRGLGLDACEGAELQEANAGSPLLHRNPSTRWSSRLTRPPKCHRDQDTVLHLPCRQPGLSPRSAWTQAEASSGLPDSDSPQGRGPTASRRVV